MIKEVKSPDATECPFDLESPVMVWRTGVDLSIPPRHPMYPGVGYYRVVFLTEKDGWEFRSRVSDCIKAVHSDVWQCPLSDTLAEASIQKRIVRLVDGKGRVIEEYPL